MVRRNADGTLFVGEVVEETKKPISQPKEAVEDITEADDVEEIEAEEVIPKTRKLTGRSKKSN